MVDGIQVMELSAWSQLPEPLLYRYFSGDLDEAKRKLSNEYAALARARKMRAVKHAA